MMNSKEQAIHLMAQQAYALAEIIRKNAKKGRISSFYVGWIYLDVRERFHGFRFENLGYVSNPSSAYFGRSFFQIDFDETFEGHDEFYSEIRREIFESQKALIDEKVSAFNQSGNPEFIINSRVLLPLLQELGDKGFIFTIIESTPDSNLGLSNFTKVITHVRPENFSTGYPGDLSRGYPNHFVWTDADFTESEKHIDTSDSDTVPKELEAGLEKILADIRKMNEKNKTKED